jgi:photosystem I subunit 8
MLAFTYLVIFKCNAKQNNSKQILNLKGIVIMAASYLPSILVPLVGLVFPAVAMASLFLYIEQEEIN